MATSSSSASINTDTVLFEQTLESFGGSEATAKNVPRRMADASVPGPHYDLVELLGRVEKFNVDLLTIAEPVNSAALGEGGVGEVIQSIQNIQFSFAFKKAKVSSGANRLSEEALHLIYRTVINEVTILQQPGVLNHPGVVDLYGITWDAQVNEVGEPTHALPILVFQVAQHGSLKNFLKTERGQKLSFGERVKLCEEVGQTLQDLHSQGIIHGDMNPNNILVFLNKSKNIHAKLTDFGFSHLSPTRQDRFNLACTPGWNAPEWHPVTLFSFVDAVKTDIYSFGKVCQWVLLGSNDHSWRTGDGQNPSLDHKTSEAVRVLLKLCLEEDPRRRPADFSLISSQLRSLISDVEIFPSLNYLSISKATSNVPSSRSQAPDTTSGKTHYIINVGRNFRRLVESHFVVRLQIVKELLARATGSCSTCQSPAAFQLALCVKFGFGIAKDREQGQKWLAASGRAEDEFRGLERLVTSSYARGQPLYTGILKNMTKEETGVLIMDTYWPVGYRRRTLLKHATEALQTERTGKIGLLDHGSGAFWAYLQLTTDLAEVLTARGQHASAALEYNHLLNNYEEMPNVPKDSSLILDTKSRLADSLWSQNTDDLRSQAILLAREVLAAEEQRALKRPDSSRAHNSAWRLSKMLSTRHELRDEADELNDQIIDWRIKNLGPGHHLTIDVINWCAKRLYEYACDFEDRKRWEKAVGMFRQVLEFTTVEYGPDNASRITTLNNLAACLASFPGDKSQDKEVLELSRQAVELRRKIFGSDHHHVVQSLLNLSVALKERGYIEEALDTEYQAMEARAEFVYNGPLDHKHTIATVEGMTHLASAFEEQGDSRMRDVVKLRKQVLDGNARIYGRQSETTREAFLEFVRSSRKLSEILWERDQIEAAIDVETTMLEDAKLFSTISNRAEETKIAKEVPQSLASMMKRYGNSLLKGKDFIGAEIFHGKAIRLLKESLGPNHEKILRYMEEISRNQIKYEQYPVAVSLRKEMLNQVIGQTTSSEDSAVSKAFLSLSRSISKQVQALLDTKQIEEAIFLKKEQYELARQYLGFGDPETGAIARELCIQHWRKGERKESLELYQSLAEEARERLGEDDSLTHVYMNNVAMNLRQMEEFDAAISLLKEIVELQTRYLGPNHADTLNTLSRLGEAHAKQAEAAIRDQGEKANMKAVENIRETMSTLKEQCRMMEEAVAVHQHALEMALSTDEVEVAVVLKAVGALGEALKKQSKMLHKQGGDLVKCSIDESQAERRSNRHRREQRS